CPIVEARPDELAEVARRDRHRVVEQLDRHIAHRRLEKDGRHAGAIRSAYVKDVARSHLTRLGLPRFGERGGSSRFRLRRTNQMRKTAAMAAAAKAGNGQDVARGESSFATTVAVHSRETTREPSDTVTFTM